ncbi:MAG TPA: hypothetical protein PK858_03800, partial [Saprospiraceae bacterium]|nr:hypothetical protein [Saprospiraceae bacterium]
MEKLINSMKKIVLPSVLVSLPFSLVTPFSKRLMQMLQPLLLFSAFLGLGDLWGQTPVPMISQNNLTYTENFSDIANWTDNFAAGIGASRWKSVAVNTTGTIPNGVRTTVSTTTFQTSGTSGGVQRGSLSSQAPGAIVLLSTGSTDNTSACAIEFFVDFSNTNAGTISFDWSRINNSTGDRAASLRVYTSTDGTTYTELTGAAVLNFVNNGGTANGSITTVALPSAFNNSSTARIRFYQYNGTGGATGSRPKIAIDNLTVTATCNSNSTPTITLGTNPTVCQGTTSANLTYSATTSSPNQYSIDYDATANTAGFVDVTNATLPVSPISLVIPNNVAAGTYNGSLTVRNSTTGCVSTTYNISVAVLPIPTLSTAVTNVPCPSSSTGAIDLTVAPTLTIDGNMNEGAWGSALATSTGGAVSSFGAGHELNAIYGIIGSNDLYFGIAGNVQNGNRILLFLDTKSGGYGDGNFGRTGAPQGIDDFNSGTTF